MSFPRLTLRALLTAAALAAPASALAAAPAPSLLGQPRFERNLDSLQYDTAASGETVATHVQGRHGGARLLLMRGEQVTELRRSAQDESYSRPLWSPDGSRFAVVHVLPAELRGQGAGRALQFRGVVQVQQPDGAPEQVPGVQDAARVLGWASDELLVISRHLPGDLPRERGWFVHLPTGALQPALEQDLAALPRGALIDRPFAQPDGLQPRGLQRAEAWTRAGQDPELDAVAVKLVGKAAFGDLHQEADEPFDLPSMPYINQRWDTPDDFDGSWACGPTSMVMTVARFGRLPKWPIQVSSPSAHTSNYGAYVSRKYCYKPGVCFDAMELDAHGKHQAWGAWGWCTDGSQAYGEYMLNYAQRHDLQSKLVIGPSFSQVQAELNAGKAIALSTQIFGYGHIIAVKGTTSDGKLIVNDPWGNATTNWNSDIDGSNAKYSWSLVNAKWYVSVYAAGAPFKASLVTKACPASMTAGGVATVSFTVKNDGSASWDSDTWLGTTEPRERASAFAVSGKWTSSKRPMKVATVVNPGASTKLEFQVQAPEVCAPKKFTEHFNLLHTGAGWFSDPSQGGPADNVLSCTIEVQPKAGACADAGAPEASAPEASAPEASAPEAAAPEAAAPEAASPEAGAKEAAATEIESPDAGADAALHAPDARGLEPEPGQQEPGQADAGSKGAKSWATQGDDEGALSCSMNGRAGRFGALWAAAAAMAVAVFGARRRGRRVTGAALGLGACLSRLPGWPRPRVS